MFIPVPILLLGLRAAFHQFDRDGDRFITMVEFKEVLSNMGEEADDEVLEEIFKTVDITGEDDLERYCMLQLP